MTHQDLDWNLYRTFLAVMREGSLSAAGRVLGMSQPTVGRQLDALEAALGASLFIRHQNGLRPTRMADELLASAQAMAGAAQQAARLASGHQQQPRGTVRVTASQMIGGEVLPGLLGPFMAQNPHIAIELVLNNQQDDLLKGEADIAIRMVRPTQQSLQCKRIGRVDIGLFAHKRYVRARGTPQTLADLMNHVLIGPDQDPFVIHMAKQQHFPIEREMFTFRSDHDMAQLAALRAGLGIAGMQLAIGRKDENLVEILSDQVTFSLDMWLVMHKDQSRSPSVKLLFRYLSESLGEYVSRCVR
ncbi:MAG TPA: LysR family transcriptional regulator [Aquabacterium sp.]|nr:LysR family transcriptional regulator [Aquabacterium sp.]